MSQPVYIDPSRRLLFVDAVIALGASLSGAVDLRGFMLKAILMPDVWTAAGLSFQASNKEDGTYQNVIDDGGTEVTVTAAQQRYIVLSAANAERFAGVNFLKVRSGTSSTPVNQVAARTLILVVAAATK